MDRERLRYMADQIARNFASQGEAEAIAATAEHIRLFWDPRMRAAIMAEDRAALSPVVAAALERLTEISKNPEGDCAVERHPATALVARYYEAF